MKEMQKQARQVREERKSQVGTCCEVWSLTLSHPLDPIHVSLKTLPYPLPSNYTPTIKGFSRGI